MNADDERRLRDILAEYDKNMGGLKFSALIDRAYRIGRASMWEAAILAVPGGDTCRCSEVADAIRAIKE